MSTYARKQNNKAKRLAGKTEKNEGASIFLGAQQRSNARRTDQNYYQVQYCCCSNASTATQVAADLFSFSFSGKGIIAAATAAAATEHTSCCCWLQENNARNRGPLQVSTMRQSLSEPWGTAFFFCMYVSYVCAQTKANQSRGALCISISERANVLYVSMNGTPRFPGIQQSNN